MSPRHLSDRRALQAAVAASPDRHIRPRGIDPRIVHSLRSTVCMCDDKLWLRHHQGRHWRVMDVQITFGHWPAASAVVNDFGSLVEVTA
nr:hypothetical protein [Variovorax boronicumulans]